MSDKIVKMNSNVLETISPVTLHVSLTVSFKEGVRVLHGGFGRCVTHVCYTRKLKMLRWMCDWKCVSECVIES